MLKFQTTTADFLWNNCIRVHLSISKNFELLHRAKWRQHTLGEGLGAVQLLDWRILSAKIELQFFYCTRRCSQNRYSVLMNRARSFAKFIARKRTTPLDSLCNVLNETVHYRIHSIWFSSILCRLEKYLGKAIYWFAVAKTRYASELNGCLKSSRFS